jgi:hypothetical protein
VARGHCLSSGYFLLARGGVGGCGAWRVCRSMMALNCSPEVACEMAVIHSYKHFWRILMRHGRNIRARQTRMWGNTRGMSHGHKEERILVGCEDVSYCALSLSFLKIPSLTMPDLLVKKQQSSPRKKHSPPFLTVKTSNPLLFWRQGHNGKNKVSQ